MQQSIIGEYMKTVDMSVTASPFEALMAHFQSSSKNVQRAFTKYIIEAYAEDVEKARQEKMVKLTLEQAFRELKNNQARPVEELLDVL